jgi:large subunit ribosomal protein L30
MSSSTKTPVKKTRKKSTKKTTAKKTTAKKATRKATTRKTIKKAVKKDKIEELQNVSLKRNQKQEQEITLCVLRVRGAHGMRRTIQRTLHLMNLYSVNSATILRSTPIIRGMLQKSKDYISFGPISEEYLKKMLKKRARLTGNKMLTDSHIRRTTVYKSIDGLAKAIYQGKIQLKEVKDLKPVFRLHPPIGGYPGSIKKSIGAGGTLGNVGSKINIYLKKMI